MHFLKLAGFSFPNIRFTLHMYVPGAIFFFLLKMFYSTPCWMCMGRLCYSSCAYVSLYFTESQPVILLVPLP